MHVDGDLAVVHGFKQRGLRFGRGAVDLVGEQDVGEDRAALEFELLLDGGVDRDAEHVGGQHVAGELNALETAVKGAGERLAESRFADAGDAFDEQVPAREDRDQGKTDDVIFAADHVAQGCFELDRAISGCGCSFRRHAKSDSTMWPRGRAVTNVTERQLRATSYEQANRTQPTL